VNIGTELRKAYISGSDQGSDPEGGKDPVYRTARALIRDRLEMAGSADVLSGE